MREQYLEKLRKLQNEVMEMGALCGEAIGKTCSLLASDRDRSVLVDEVDHLEQEIDEKERSAESMCIQLLLRQQPVAADLRRISASLKMITDLERIGDQAIDIAEILQTGSIHVPVRGVQIGEMAEKARSMVGRSMEAYSRCSLDSALEVIESDDELDGLFLQVRRELNESSFSADQALDLLMIAKYYERIGDHAVNVSEWVEFSITGKHRSGKVINDVFGAGRY